MAKDRSAKIRSVWTVSVLVSASIFVFGTFTVFHGNVSEFEVGYFSLLAVLVPPGLILVALLLVLGIVCPSRAVDRYSSALFAFAVLLGVQGCFLMGSYGVLDDRGVNWQQSSLPGWLDASIWILVLAASIRFSAHIAALVPFMSGVLLSLQLTLMLTLAGASREELWVKARASQGRVPMELLKYSSSQNIVHIILDSFQTDIFWELVAEEGLEDDLEGFVLFKENMGTAPYTSFSIPAIFSGRIYDGMQPPSSYYQDSIRSGFQSRLYDAGYTVNLIPHESMGSGKYTNYYDIPSVYGGHWKEIVHANAARLLNVALFRQAPHWVRKQIYNDNNWFIDADWFIDNNWFIKSPVVQPVNVVSFQEKAFVRDYVQNINIGDSKPAYHFLHLIPPHPPYVTLRNGAYAGNVLPNTRENYKNEARAILQLFMDLVDRLKELSIYDSSLILLQGDHGSQILPVVDGETIITCVSRLAALLTIKLPRSSGSLRVSSAQTSLLDIPATITRAIGFGNGMPGRSVFEIDQTEPRKRPFVIYQEGGDGPHISKYSINGSVFDPAACVVEGHAAVLINRPQYEYGMEIRFGMMGNSDSYMGFGWGPPSSRARWNDGDRASLVFRIDPPNSDLVLKVGLAPYVRFEGVPKQTIHVFANGTKIDEWLASEWRMHSDLPPRTRPPSKLDSEPFEVHCTG